MIGMRSAHGFRLAPRSWGPKEVWVSMFTFDESETITSQEETLQLTSCACRGLDFDTALCAVASGHRQGALPLLGQVPRVYRTRMSFLELVQRVYGVKVSCSHLRVWCCPCRCR